MPDRSQVTHRMADSLGRVWESTDPIALALRVRKANALIANLRAMADRRATAPTGCLFRGQSLPS